MLHHSSAHKGTPRLRVADIAQGLLNHLADLNDESRGNDIGGHSARPPENDAAFQQQIGEKFRREQLLVETFENPPCPFG